uniref:Uncharacterized protein n=1 Tax=Coccidioides posadasii RMSCC 3488 TaxID=454284 RepID=A0A0J6IK17_COCPO|nr:hypothetical protein CPAG_08569 [Coccidioides posadasii RMSCC 3488]
MVCNILPMGQVILQVDILRRGNDLGQDHNNEGQLILDSPADPFTPDSAGPLEPLVSAEHLSPASPPKPPLSGLDKHPDEEAYQELPHGSQEASTTIEAETNARVGRANSARSPSVVRRIEPERPKDVTGATPRNTGQRQYPFRRRRPPSDAGSMQTMVAVVIPASKGPRDKRRRSQAGPDRHPHGHAVPAADQGESDTGSQHDPSDYSDDDYAANSSDASDSVKKPVSKRRKISSWSTVTTSCPSSSRHRSQPQIARAVKDRGRPKSKSQNMQLTNVSSPNIAAQTESCRWLSPEDISALVSAFTQKLLGYRRDPSPGPAPSADDEEAMTDTQSTSDSELRGKLGTKPSWWTRHDEERLIKMKAQGWRW